MLYYKLELTADDMIRVLDIVEEKQDDEFIYATEDEFKRLKQGRVIDYNVDVFNTFNRKIEFRNVLRGKQDADNAEI